MCVYIYMKVNIYAYTYIYHTVLIFVCIQIYRESEMKYRT